MTSGTAVLVDVDSFTRTFHKDKLFFLTIASASRFPLWKLPLFLDFLLEPHNLQYNEASDDLYHFVYSLNLWFMRENMLICLQYTSFTFNDLPHIFESLHTTSAFLWRDLNCWRWVQFRDAIFRARNKTACYDIFHTSCTRTALGTAQTQNSTSARNTSWPWCHSSIETFQYIHTISGRISLKFCAESQAHTFLFIQSEFTNTSSSYSMSAYIIQFR